MLYRGGDIEKVLHQNAHCIREDVTSWCRTSCPLLLNGFMCPYPFQNLKDLRVRETFIGSKKLSRDHRSWSLTIRAEFRTPVSYEIALSVAVSAWPHNVRLVENLAFTEGVITVEPVSRKDYRHVTTTVMVMRYVKAVCTLECAHRRQLLLRPAH